MTAETTTGRGTRSGGAHWSPGTRILWRYRDNGDGHIHICRPVTVVQDTDDLLAVWMAPGTECVKPVLADGSPVHEEPLATRYTAPRTTVRTRWEGAGVLKLARPDEPWSVWLFWEGGWRFRSWYVNLEEPRTRWADGVDSEDHFLDISVYPDRSWLWRDEDEFAQAQRSGLMGPAQARRVARRSRTAGRTGGRTRAGRFRHCPGTGIAPRRPRLRETLDAPMGCKRRIVLRASAER
jgi:hypothetical protein